MTDTKLLQAIFDCSPAAIMVADDQGRYVEVNKATEDLLGAKREEIIGKTIHDFVAPLRQETVGEMWEKFQSTKNQEGFFDISRPTGVDRKIYYRARVHFLPGLHLSVAFDVTDTLKDRAAKEKWESVTQAQIRR